MHGKRILPLLTFSILSSCVAALAPTPAAGADSDNGKIEQRLEELKAMKKDLARQMDDFDARIKRLEAAEKAEQTEREKLTAAQAETERKIAAVEAKPIVISANAPQPPSSKDEANYPGFGTYLTNKGFILTSGPLGEVSMTLIAYLRYLNQLGLNRSYTDSFGRTFTLKLRQDVQWNKVNISFKGWVLDPDLTYRVWVWTQQPAMGQGAQVVVGGQLGYHFSDALNLYGGIAPLPTTRSTNWTYPFWLKMDNRTIADEFFRGSYSQGIWIDGRILDDVEYRAMIANNLSALGISADQLDAEFNTMSVAVLWMPTTGEFGPAEGFGDYQQHEEVATLVGAHYTRSRESAQEQPNVNDFENSQIRLSDGTLLFSANPFNTGGSVEMATYQMMDLEAGVKYEGFSLEGEYYTRWVDQFKTIGFIPVDHLFDTGFQLQASGMILPKELQAYVSGSQVYGHYGKPWDLTLGLNWFPFKKGQMHINAEGIYLYHSPVGGLSYPYIVGGTGWLYNTDFIITF